MNWTISNGLIQIILKTFWKSWGSRVGPNCKLNKLFNKLKELKVSLTPSKTFLWSFWITFRSKFKAVNESSLWSTPGCNVFKTFWAKSKKARPLRSLTALGMSFSWQPFRLRFFSDVSKPRRALSVMVTLLSANFKVFSLNVTNAFSGMYVILLSDKSNWDKSLSVLKGTTGTLRRLFVARFRLWRVFSRPRNALSFTEIMSQAVKEKRYLNFLTFKPGNFYWPNEKCIEICRRCVKSKNVQNEKVSKHVVKCPQKKKVTSRFWNGLFIVLHLPKQYCGMT